MTTDKFKWYVIHTYASYETIVQTNLEKMIENNNLQEYIGEISIPTEPDIVEKNGKRKIVERKKFAGYVFIKMFYNDNVGFMVRNTRGVTGFVGPQGKAMALTPDEVRRMGIEKVVTADFKVKPGDSIKIISGPLENFVAVVDEVFEDKQKIKGIVQMFGRETPVELEFSQIEIARK